MLQNVDACSGCGWRHQLAAALFVASGNASWADAAKRDVLRQATALTPASGSWFAGSERALQQLVASYDVVYEVCDSAERRAIEAALAACADYLYESPPAGIGVAADMASRLMNPAADRLAAVGLIALALPAHANASAWLGQSVREFTWMLQNGVMRDGQWHEPSTRYHGRVLAAFIPFAYALRHAGVMDVFQGSGLAARNFKLFVGWYTNIQTPPDKTMGGCALTPALSDGNWETVWEVTLGWAAGGFEDSDPTYARRLFRAWERACAPVGLEPSPPNQLASLLFIPREPFLGSGKKTKQQLEREMRHARASTILSGYAVLEQPALEASRPYFIMSTATQRQTEGHEHPDRGSFSLYSHDVPLVIDPGVGWCGYNWFGEIPKDRADPTSTAFDQNLTFGAWYRGSQSHSMVNFATEGPCILPENETWRPAGAYGHEWGLRGAAWVDTHVFSAAMDYVDLNVTRAVQSSQRPGVAAYHRRVFANRADDAYLIWDMVDAPLAAEDCEAATFNLHVLTQLGWPGKIGCAKVPSAAAAAAATSLECRALENMTLDVTLLLPTDALKRNLLHVEADPLPIQFVGMTGTVGAQPGLGMPSTGGALGGDWNAAENMVPRVAHYPPRTPTWLRVNGATALLQGGTGSGGQPLAPCAGFLTLLQPRNTTTLAAKVAISAFEQVQGFSLGSSAVTLQTELPLGPDNSSQHNTLYLLGDRPESDVGPQLRGVAAVVGWDNIPSSSSLDAPESLMPGIRIGHVLLVKASRLDTGNRLGASRPLSLRTKYGSNVTLTMRSLQRDTGLEQYTLRVQELEPARRGQPVMLSLTLPWGVPLPVQVNVWRGAHVWHVANSTKSAAGAERQPVVEFEVLPGLDYLIERECIRSSKAGYNDGKGGWLCSPGHPYSEL